MKTNKVCVFAVKVKSEKAITPRVPKIWTDENVIIPDIVMLVLVLLFALALFMIVIPLVSKKFFRK